MNKKKVLFVVQGEGRGHMTQSIALHQLMNYQKWCEVVCVMIGKSAVRNIPDFFRKEFVCPIIEFESPNFLQDKNSTHITVWKSVFYNLLKARTFFRSISNINKAVKQYKPDIIINFYEPLAGLYNFIYRPKVKTICIAHQYIYLHPDFKFPNEVSVANTSSVKWLTRITGLRAHKKIALSFYDLPRNKYRNILVTPPLLRSIVVGSKVKTENYILVYLLNSGLMQNIIQWHKLHPEVVVHCFTDFSNDNDEWKYNNNLIFHKLNDEKFINFMAECAGVVTTAGFETVCEAMYMGKPVLMVPVKNHFEQFCNSRDAYKAGAGIYHDEFNMNLLVECMKSFKQNIFLKEWVNSFNKSFLEEIV